MKDIYLLYISFFFKDGSSIPIKFDDYIFIVPNKSVMIIVMVFSPTFQTSGRAMCQV